MLNKKPLCIAPWMHLHIEQTGRVRPCCMYLDWETDLGNINENTWEEIWNGEKFQKLRQQFLEVEKGLSENCIRCLQYEKAGGYSLRRGCNLMVPDISLPLYLEEPRVISLDVRLSNFCTGACCQCNEWNSTAWAKEKNNDFRGLSEQGIANVLDLVNKNKQYLKKIAIAGGETLMIPSTFEIFNILKGRGFAGELSLFFNTNGVATGIKGNDVFDYLSNFTHTTAEVSLDAIGSAAEYIRYNLPWKKILVNLEKYYKWYKDNPEAHRFTIHPTVFVHSVLRIPELLHFLDEKYPDIEVIPGNFLNTPEYFDIQRLPQDLKNFVIERLTKDLESFTNIRSRVYIQSMLDYLLASTTKECMWDRCKQEILTLDSKRHNNFLDINPEFKPWF